MNKPNNTKDHNLQTIVKIVFNSINNYLDNIYIKYLEGEYIEAFGLTFVIYLPTFILLITKILCSTFASRELNYDIENISRSKDTKNLISALTRNYHNNFDSDIKAGKLALTNSQNNIEIMDKALSHFLRAFYNSNTMEERIVSSILYQSAFVNIYSKYTQNLGEIGIQSIQYKLKFNETVLNYISTPSTYIKIMESDMSNGDKLSISKYLLDSVVFINRYNSLQILNVLDKTQAILNSIRGFVYQIDLVNSTTRSIYSAYYDQL